MRSKWFLALILCLLLSLTASAEELPMGGAADGEWVTFFLLCNEGMLNDGGDVGNTVMIISMNAAKGSVKQLMFTWDSFIDYPGFEMPQLLDKPFRVGGPEETLKLFNRNFEQDIPSYLSINFMNLASLIDSFGGVTVDVTRAERNALNGMVASKKTSALSALKSYMLDESLYEALFDSYYLNEYGPETHLSGMQAVAFGWLQYDSVVNCCEREAEVTADLFRQMGVYVKERAAFYIDGEEEPDVRDGRRPINLDRMSDEDREFLYTLIAPVFEKSANNLTREEIDTIAAAIARAAYEGQRMGRNIFDSIDYRILPLESGDAYTTIAGIEGRVLDYEANAQAIHRFLYEAGESPILAKEP